MFDKYFVGSDVFSSSNNGKYKPVSRITLKVDDSNVLTAGDDTGFELIADCPHATQDIVDSLLLAFKGYEYQSFSADDANINPSAELGDGVTVQGIYSVLSMMHDDGTGYPSLEAPGKAEDEDEYPSGGPMTQEFERQLARTRSLISKTSEEIRLEVFGEDGYTGASVHSLISTAIKKIKLEVSSKDGSTTLTLTDKDTTLSTQTLNLTVDAINISGKLTADQIDASKLKVSAANVTGQLVVGSLPDGVAMTDDIPTDAEITVITNNAIRTASISANQVTAGTFAGGNLSLTGLLSLLYGSSQYGYVGASTAGMTAGAVLTDSTKSNFFIATNTGARMSYNAINEIYCAANGCRSTSEIVVDSDARLKNSVSYDLSKEEKMFELLKPCSFAYNRDECGKKHLGFIAQEMAESIESVGMDLDTLSVLSKNDSGMYGIAYGEIVALNTHMIQKLVARVAELERKMEE